MRKDSPSGSAVNVDPAQFLALAMAHSLGEIGALVFLAACSAAGDGTLLCAADGRPDVLQRFAGISEHWEKLARYFLREGDRLRLDPACPCRCGGTAGAKTRKPCKRLEWTGTIPLQLDQPAFRAAWSEWLAYRREEKREPVTPRAGNMQLEDLALMGPVRALAAIRWTIAKSWLGIREPSAGERVTASLRAQSGYCPHCLLERVDIERHREVCPHRIAAFRRSKGPAPMFAP